MSGIKRFRATPSTSMSASKKKLGTAIPDKSDASNSRDLRSTPAKNGPGASTKKAAGSKSSQSANASASTKPSHYFHSNSNSDENNSLALKAESNNQILDVVGRALRPFPWYHGHMPQEDVEDYVKEPGDFLVRRTSIDGIDNYILTVVCLQGDKRNINHIGIEYKDYIWTINDTICKASLKALVKHYENKPSKYSTVAGAFLKNGIPRPQHFLLHEDIQIGSQIGKGAFGTVHIGRVKRTRTDKCEIECAIKKMKSDKAVKKSISEFFKEGRLMLKLHHANIVQIYGVAPGDQPILIVLELAKGGSLKSYCKNNDPVPTDQLMKFTKDGLRGMTYLQSIGIIHRDLAARNCLLGANDELKISDFGLSRTGSLQLDKLQNVPVKWLAPETLNKGMFTHKTDVWSFGVLIWEIFTRCKTDPFPGMNNGEAMKQILEKKPPIEPPTGTPDNVAALMKQCLTFDESSRPEFGNLFKTLMPDETPTCAQNSSSSQK